MNIQYLIGLCFVAVSVSAMIEFIAWGTATYPVAATVAVIIFVAGGFYRVRNEYKRRSGRKR